MSISNYQDKTMRKYKNIFNTAISMSIILSSINFYYPAQAGVMSAVQALSKGKVTKTLKAFAGSAAHGAGTKVGGAAAAYILTQFVKLPDGQVVRVCQDVQPNGYRTNPYYC